VTDPTGRDVEYFLEFDLDQLRDTDRALTDGASPDNP
jgi:hypothetical protein